LAVAGASLAESKEGSGKMRKMITAGVAVAVPLLCAILAPSASALSLCLPVNVKATGVYEDAKCEHEQAKGGYVLAVPMKKISSEVWCAKLDNGSKVGYYENDECNTEAPEKGAYDLVKLTKAEAEEVEEKENGLKNPEFSRTGVTFLGTTGTFKWGIGTGLDELVCSNSSETTGIVTSTTSVGGFVIELTGCRSTDNDGSTWCTAKGKGLGEGDIATTTLKGTLGTVKLSEAQSGVGLLVEPVTTKTIVSIEGNGCLEAGEITGQVAAEMSPVKVSQKTGKLVFGATAESQSIKKIAVGGEIVKPALHGFLGEDITEEDVESLSYAASIEIV
jgi:hypothetical protein